MTIFLRNGAAHPGYNELLALLDSHGARDVFGIQNLDSFGDQSESTAVRSSRAAVVYWLDSAARVSRLLPSIRTSFPDCVATVEDTTIAFDTTTSVPDLPGAMIVADVMTTDPVTVEPDVSLDELIYLMVRRNLRAVPVVDADDRLAGIVTNSDLVARAGLPLRLELLRSLSSEAQSETLKTVDWSGKAVAEVMTRSVITVPSDHGIQDVARMMLERKLKRLPVVDADNRLVGVVSRVDLLRAISFTPDVPAELGDHFAGSPADTPLRDVMSRTVPEVREDATLSETLAAVISTRLNRAIVVDADRRVVGIVSDADLLERLTPQFRPGAMSVLMHRLPHARAKAEFEDTLRHTTGQRAKDVMHADALVLREDEGLGSVVPRVLAQEGKAVPVVDSDERLVGVLDRSHLLWAVLGAPESWPIG